MENHKIEISGIHLIKAILLMAGVWIIAYYGSTLLLPLLVSALIATLLDKPTKLFKKWGFPDWLAITASILLMSVILFLLFWLISSQVSNIADDWPVIKRKAIEKYDGFNTWTQHTFNIHISHFVNNNVDYMDRLKKLFSLFLSSLSNLFSQSFIILVYIILFLMQKKHFIGFFQKLVKNERGGSAILKGASQIISGYLSGKAKIMVFLFLIYYGGFTLGQVPFALFLALFAALFSIIPYVGNIIGGGAAVILAYLYSGSTPAFIVIAVIAAAQVVENYILTPWIIGDQINLNPFVTVFGVILLSVLWGLVGAIIALPIIGVLKVLFDHTREMEPYAYFLKKQEE